MTPKPIIVRPFFEGWGVQDRGEWRGPYLSREIAVQLAMAELKRRHALLPNLRLLVIGEDGTVLLEWPDTAPADDLTVVEVSPERSSESMDRSELAPVDEAPRSSPRLRDWRDDPRRYCR